MAGMVKPALPKCSALTTAKKQCTIDAQFIVDGTVRCAVHAYQFEVLIDREGGHSAWEASEFMSEADARRELKRFEVMGHKCRMRELRSIDSQVANTVNRSR